MRKWISLMALCLMAQALEARRCDQENLLIFGNSLSDTGNAVAVSTAAGLPVNPPNPPYLKGRFADGYNWVDFVTDLTGLNPLNFAIGGATTGTANEIDGYPFYGLTQEIGLFAQQNNFRVNSNTTTVVEIGANDLLALTDDPSNITPALVTQTITQAITNLQGNLVTLMTIGSKKNIIWDVPDLGLVPLFQPPSPLAPLQSTFSQISQAYNGALLQLVSGLNAQSFNHAVFFYFPFSQIVQEVLVELEAEGVDPTKSAYFTTFDRPPGPVSTFLGTPPSELAFMDQIHPSTRAWQLFAPKFAGYLDNLLEGPKFVAVQQDLLFETARAHRDLVGNHFRTIYRNHFVCPPSYDDCCDFSQLAFYIDGEGKWGDVNTNCGTKKYNYDTGLVMVGADYVFNECVVAGASYTYETTRANVDGHYGHIDLVDNVPTVYVALAGDQFFAEADVSYHFYDFHNIRRHIHFVDFDTKAKTHGWGVEANAIAGFTLQCGCIVGGPWAGFGYEQTQIKGYREKGCRADYLHFKIESLRQDSFLGRLGLMAFWADCDCMFTPYLSLTYEHEFTRTRKTVRAKLFQNVCDGAIDRQLTGKPNRDTLSFDLGVDIGITDCITGNIAYEGETQFNNYSQAVKGEIRISF